MAVSIMHMDLFSQVIYHGNFNIAIVTKSTQCIHDIYLKERKLEIELWLKKVDNMVIISLSGKWNIDLWIGYWKYAQGEWDSPLDVSLAIL